MLSREELINKYTELMKKHGFDDKAIELSLSPQLGRPIKNSTISKFIKMIESLLWLKYKKQYG